VVVIKLIYLAPASAFSEVNITLVSSGYSTGGGSIMLGSSGA